MNCYCPFVGFVVVFFTWASAVQVQRLLAELHLLGEPPSEVMKQIAPKEAENSDESFEAGAKNTRDPFSDQSRFSVFSPYLANLVYWVGFGTVMMFKTHLSNVDFMVF